MSAIAQKVGTLWQRGSRWHALLIVLTLTTGVTAFATLLSTQAILSREGNRGYAATRPADATIVVDAADDELVASLRAVQGVTGVDARRIVSGRIRTGPLQWRQLLVFSPRSFDDVAVSRFGPQEGSWPPATGEMLVERDALGVAKAAIGDLATIRFEDGEEHTLRIAGTAHDPGQAQAKMENVVYAYVTRETLAQLGQPTELDRVLLKVDEGSAGSATIQSDIREVIERSGRTIHRMEHGTGHPHASLMRLLFDSQLVLGLLALLLAAIVAAQLFTARMATQVRQIGVMKAIGASPRQVAAVYLRQAAWIGCIVTALAVPLGMLASRLLGGYLAVFLNFDLVSVSAPCWILLLQVVVGLLLPLIAAAWPVARGIRSPVVKALAQHGVGERAFGSSGFDRLTARLGGGRIARPVLYAIRNASRRRWRTALNVAALAIGGIVFLSAFDLRTSMTRTLDRMFGDTRYDLTVNLGSLQSVAAVERAARATDGVLTVESWVTMSAPLPGAVPTHGHPRWKSAEMAALERMHGGGEGQLPMPTIQVQAPPPNTQMFAPKLMVGRAVSATETDTIVLNQAAAALAGTTTLGHELSLLMGGRERTLCVVGILRDPFSPPTGYVSAAATDAAGYAGRANLLRLALRADGTNEDAIAAELEHHLRQEGVQVRSSQATSESRFVFDQHFEMVYQSLLIVAGIVILVGGLGLLSALALGLSDRRTEFGVLRALGAPPSTIGMVVMLESCFVALAAWALALAGAWALISPNGLLRLFPRRLEPSMDALAPWMWLAVALAVGVLASLVPTWRAARTSVREALSRP